MATVKISELPAILGAATATTDVLPLVDVSANTTNKITRAEFFSNIGNLSGVGTITGATTLSLLTTTTSAFTLDSGTTGAINIGTNANAKTITIGNGTGATSLVLNAGTGAINIGTNAIARTITVGNTTGASALTLEAGTGALNIGTGAFAKTITIGNGTGATSLVLNAGTGAINIGTNAIARIVTVGNATGASAVAINSGTGNIILNGANANNVGIGTAAPAAKLDVSGGVIADNVSVENASSVSGSGMWGTTTTLAFNTGSTERMRIDASGNLGLGVTPSAWATLVPAIQLGGGGSFIAAQGSGTVNSDSIYIGTNAHFDGTNWLYKETNNASYFLQANGQHRFFTAPSGTAGNAITFTQAMTLDASGNLGIGTTSPTAGYRLDVFGQAQIGDGGGNADINFNASSTGRFLVAGTERLRITSAGFVGIGSTAPVVSLHVVGDTMTTGVVYKNQPAQASKAAAATLTIAELETGIIQYTGAAATLTLPTGTLIEGGVPASFPVNMAFDFSVINTGTGTATLGTATGLTLIGAMGVAINTTGMFRVRKTATNAFTVYRVG